MKRFPALAMLSLLGIFGVKAQSPSLPEEQRSLSIYQIMVASFQHGEGGAPGYSQMWGPDSARKDGNLRGIINALDHIQSLGVNAIWLTPVFDSSSAFGGEKLQATGYFTNDYFKVDPHFGTYDDLRELIDEAHRRGLYVFLDGVFGHHGGVVSPSPNGSLIDSTVSSNDRNEGTGNVKFPESLDYFKEVATYWINEFNIDGWRLDQAYQVSQGGHNYWKEIRKAVEDVCAKRKAEGHKWGILGYMVGEDWGNAQVINNSTFRDAGLLSAFDFEGKERISGPMQDVSGAGLENGWDDVIWMLQPPRQRGYISDDVAPNLFLTNHDGYRLADHFDPGDPLYYEKQMARFAILAAYNGPITIYYGDEYADRSLETTGGQKDNIARTSGHLEPRTTGEASLRDYLANALAIRRDNPAMWRGQAFFKKDKVASADVLVVTKTDPLTGNEVLIVFSNEDTTVPVHGYGGVDVDAWRPEIIVKTPVLK